MSDDTINASKLFVVIKKLISVISNTLIFDYKRFNTNVDIHAKNKQIVRKAPNSLTMIYTRVFIERNEKSVNDVDLSCMDGTLESSLHIHNHITPQEKTKLRFGVKLPQLILEQASALPNVVQLRPKYTYFEIYLKNPEKLSKKSVTASEASTQIEQTSNKVEHNTEYITAIYHLEKPFHHNLDRFVAYNSLEKTAECSIEERIPCSSSNVNLDDEESRKISKSVEQDIEINVDTKTDLHKDVCFISSTKNNNMARKCVTRGIFKSAGESNPDVNTKKQVCFNLIPEVHVIRAWDYAYRSARKGIWETCARDRYRFQQRIQRSSVYLNPILNVEHRSKIFNTRFACSSIENE